MGPRQTGRGCVDDGAGGDRRRDGRAVERTVRAVAAGAVRRVHWNTATYGHFGRNDLDLPWERLDRVDEVGEAVKGV